ncbi:MAG: hypothetical protein R3190_10845, partial [Thermoanaerobaculia bacterium]|nr:hypothetical protein [Thermoanaerobaculia bacterium]
GFFAFVWGDADKDRPLHELGVLPWWTAPDMRAAFWRPASALTHLLDHRLWPDLAWLQHVHSLAWMGLLAWLAARLYRQVMGPDGPGAEIAGLAAILYAVDDAHAMPMFWIANRNAVVGGVLATTTLLAHFAWRRAADRSRQAAWAAVAHACLLGALLASEGALSVTAYLFAAAVVLETEPLGRRLAGLAGYAAIVFGWRLAYDAQGYGAAGSNAYLDPGADPVGLVGRLFVQVPVYLAALWAGPPSEVFTALSGGGRTVYLAWSIAVVALVLAALAPILRRDRRARFWLLALVVALVPACAIWPMDRIFVFAGIGGTALVAMLVHAWEGPRWRRFVAGAFVVLHLIVTPVLLPVRIVASSLAFEALTVTAATAPLPDRAGELTMIVVDDPTMLGSQYVPLERWERGLDAPATLALVAPPSLVSLPMRFHRLDATTLDVDIEGRWQWLLFRDATPFQAGERIPMQGWEVEVLEVTSGLPTRIRLRFDRPLEDPSYVWLEYAQGSLRPPRQPRLVPWRPPAIGSSVMLNAAAPGS